MSLGETGDMDIQAAAKSLMARASQLGIIGRIATPKEIQSLEVALSGAYPMWLADLVSSVPLCGLEIGWQAHEPDGDFDGIEWLEWCDAAGVISESVDCYPGIAILPAGYINVASCTGGSGNPYFVSIHEGNDPPLYRVFHDVGAEASVVLATGRERVSDTLSSFFKTAILTQDRLSIR